MMYGQMDPRLPLEPLWRYVQRRHRQVDRGQRETFGAVDIAAEVGVHSRTVKRWRHTGLTWDHADKAAIRLGSHPALIWGNEWWALVPTQFEDVDDHEHAFGKVEWGDEKCPRTAVTAGGAASIGGADVFHVTPVSSACLP